MNFLIFRDFPGFFRIYFRFLNVKNNLKLGKMWFIFAWDSRGCDVGTPGHVAVPRGPTRRLHGDVTHIYIYIYRL